MNRGFLFFIISCVCIISSTTLILILYFINPYTMNGFVLVSFYISFILSITTFFTIFLFFLKKVYYRGHVVMLHVMSSFRQGLFISLFGGGLGIFYSMGVPLFLSGIILGIILVFVELFIQNIIS